MKVSEEMRVLMQKVRTHNALEDVRERSRSLEAVTEAADAVLRARGQVTSINNRVAVSREAERLCRRY